jgi:methionyl-tRNA formyltransferase
MRIVFAGTPEFAAIALRSLCEAGFDVPLVLTQPDRPAGRGMRLQPSAVKQYALAHGIPVTQPLSLRLDGKSAAEARQAHDLLLATQFDAMVVVAYGLILPRSILDIPPLGCINIHASLLPRWRGAAPIQRAIEAGDRETGITIMQMDEGLDTGPVLMQQSISIENSDDAGSLHDKLAALGASMIVSALHRLERSGLHPKPQPETGANYAAKITKEEAAIDFKEPSAKIANKIRALNPFPGAVAMFEGTPVKIWRAEAITEATSGASGEVLAADAQSGVLVACGGGVLRLAELQKPGGKRLPAVEFIKGFSLDSGRFA